MESFHSLLFWLSPIFLFLFLRYTHTHMYLITSSQENVNISLVCFLVSYRDNFINDEHSNTETV